MTPNNHANCQQYDDRFATHAFSSILPYDVGLENLLIGAHHCQQYLAYFLFAFLFI